MVTVPEWWNLLWATWDVRGVILLSLVLQTFLIFFAPLRKRVSTNWLTTPLWLAWLLADNTATYGVGLISKSQIETTSGPVASRTLLAFWAPFLLVHLGGPDTITAFALEDNELWLRHLYSLVFQVLLVIFAFFQSFPNHKFWLPTLLMFVSGVIRYAERTRAFYLASSRKFKASLLPKPDPGPNYAKFMKSNPQLKTIEWVPESTRVNRSRTNEKREELPDWKVVQVAHKYFSVFNGLIADSIFSFRERNLTREFFLKQTARDAFKVVEVELNFFYDILYTKATVVHGMGGYILRFISLCLNFATIVIFYFIDKKEFKKFDVGISYSLLLGAIALDLTAWVMILHSDWAVVALIKSNNTNWFIKILKRLHRVARVKIIQRRWSESLSKYNLLYRCLHPRAKWLEKTIGTFGLTDMIDGMEYVETQKFTNDLRNFIFKELKMKSEKADTIELAKEIFSARGDWILKHESGQKDLTSGAPKRRKETLKDLLRWIKEVEFDESLILWHIATDLCYYHVEVNKNANDGGNPPNLETRKSINEDIKDYRKLAKLLSDYMLYLLIMQSTMLSDVAGIGQTRFRDTCAEAERFFHENEIMKEENCCLGISNFGKCFCGNVSECCNKCSSKWANEQDELQREACKRILEVDTSVEPFAVKRDRSKSVLFDACMLAKELKKLESDMWEIISKVWVELLCYAACHCKANTRVAQLNKGGQLLTLVWLLMAHFGLDDHFQIREGHARAKLIVKKQVEVDESV